MRFPRSPLTLLIGLLILVALLATFGPAEASLGPRARIVYLHGAWVWTALAAIGAAGVFGLIGLGLRARRLQEWSVALGQAGTFFWVTYLPLSLWAMQANWNGLFLDEPRWKVGVNFAIGGLLIQAGILVVGRPGWAGLANALFAGALFAALLKAEAVMHPASPITSSDSALIQSFFLALLAACLLACWLLARWLLGHWARFRHEPAE